MSDIIEQLILLNKRIFNLNPHDTVISLESVCLTGRGMNTFTLNLSHVLKSRN